MENKQGSTQNETKIKDLAQDKEFEFGTVEFKPEKAEENQAVRTKTEYKQDYSV